MRYLAALLLTGCTAANVPSSKTWEFTNYELCDLNLVSKVADRLPATLGMTVMRTDLPRYDSLRSERARLIENGQVVKLHDELADIPGQVGIQLNGFDNSEPLYYRQWESPQNAIYEDETGELNITDDTYQLDLYRGDKNLSAVSRVSGYNGGYSLLSDTRILFQAIIGGKGIPYVMNNDGSNKHPWIDGSGYTYSPQVSPDGNHYAYNSGYKLYIDGVKVNTPCEFNFQPHFSPDSKRILFYCGLDDISPDLFFVNTDRTGLTFLASRNGFPLSIPIIDTYDFHGGSSDTPLWIDNDTVLYTARSGDSLELFKSSLNRVTVKLTDTRSLNYHPVLSPDGTQVAFVSNRNGFRETFVLDLVTLETKQLTIGKPGCATAWPRWSK